MRFNREITDIDYDNLCPFNVNEDMRSRKFLPGEQGNVQYMVCENVYRYFLEQYLINKTSIKRIDDNFTNSDLNFQKVLDSDKDFYQYYSNLNYLYIRNTLYVEKLSSNDLNMLINRYNKQDKNFDDEMMNLIERTYKSVIKTDINNEEELIQKYGQIDVNYGPEIAAYTRPINALVIGFRCMDKEIENESIDEHIERTSKENEFKDKCLRELEEDIKNRLGVGCSAIEYDEFSIKKKVEMDNSYKNNGKSY